VSGLSVKKTVVMKKPATVKPQRVRPKSAPSVVLSTSIKKSVSATRHTCASVERLIQVSKPSDAGLGSVVWTNTVNPGFFCPADGLLSNIAVNYEKYVVKNLVIKYVPSVASTVGGVVVLGMDLGFGDNAPTTSAQMTLLSGGYVEGKVWENIEYRVPLHLLDKREASRYVRTNSAYSYGSTSPLYDLGVFYAFVDNAGSSAASFGYLEARYEFEFIGIDRNRVEPTLNPLAIDGYAECTLLTNLTGSANPFSVSSGWQTGVTSSAVSSYPTMALATTYNASWASVTGGSLRVEHTPGCTYQLFKDVTFSNQAGSTTNVVTTVLYIPYIGTSAGTSYYYTMNGTTLFTNTGGTWGSCSASEIFKPSDNVTYFTLSLHMVVTGTAAITDGLILVGKYNTTSTSTTGISLKRYIKSI
jgi:hypothetical protein